MKKYLISEIAEISGVSIRTLQHYDQIGLLQPNRFGNHYRYYTDMEIDILQQILIYKELGLKLKQIISIVKDERFNVKRALEEHRIALLEKREHLNDLIKLIDTTIAKKGENMRPKDKFTAFKKEMISENEAKYGKEIRKKYGEENVDASNAKLMNLSETDYQKVQELSTKIHHLLQELTPTGDYSSGHGYELFKAHREWLCYFWKDYSCEAHCGLAQTYIDDPRFKQYYENITPGAAQFLYQTIINFTKE